MIGKKAATIAAAGIGGLIMISFIRRVARRRARRSQAEIPAAVRAVVERLPQPVVERVGALDLDQVKKILGVAATAATLAARLREYRHARAAV
ncbi:MAG: hypothetical protein ABR552_11610 [Actinomycetota bacterium]